MQTHETPSFQPAASSLKNNLPAPRPFEDTHSGQELDSLSTNPFPPRPHEVWMGEPRGGSTNPFPRRPHEVDMGEPKIARKPISPPVQAEATLDPEASPYIFGNRPFRMNPPDAPPPPPRRWGIQAKVAIGQPNDVYEQEADRVAEQVMGMSSAAFPTVQRQVEEEEPEELQTKPLAETITPLMQRQADLGKEEPIQAKCENCEAEEPIQRFADGTAQAQPDLENRLNSSKSGGSALPDDVRSFMEPRFGADFSQVRVHTSSEAVQMNRDLSAQAFTHQQDIYFGSGKSPTNETLTAHELTHVIQQTGGVQIKCSNRETKEAEVQRSHDISSTSNSIQKREVCNEEGVCRSEPDPVESNGSNVVTLPEIVIEGDPNNSELDSLPADVKENETSSTWQTVKEGAAGVTYGAMQGLTPGGSATPSPMPKSRAFEFFRGAGQIATGAAQTFVGAGGEVFGLGLDATGGGAVVGVPINVASAAAAANGVTSVISGVGTVAHAWSMGSGTGEKTDAEQTTSSPYGKDSQGVVWTEPQTMAEQAAMDAAKSGEGKVIKPGPFHDPKYKDDPGWEKWEYLTTTADGNKIEVHYMKNTITGQTDQFKFLSRGSYPKPALEPKSPE